MGLRNRLLGIDSTHESLFFEKEYTTLAGKRQVVIRSLIIILILTFAAISFAVGAIESLGRKMENPFTNWVDTPLKMDGGLTGKNVKEILGEFNSDSTKTKYGLQSADGVATLNMDFYRQRFDPVQHRPDTLRLDLNGQVVDYDSQLFGYISADNNLLWSSDKSDTLTPNAQAIVMKLDALEGIGLSPPYDSIGQVLMQTLSEEIIPIQIAAVVRQLPKNNAFVCSSTFYNIFQLSEENEHSCAEKVQSNDRGGNSFKVITAIDSDRERLSSEAKAYFNAQEDITLTKGVKKRLSGRGYLVADLLFGYGDTPDLDEMEAFCSEMRQEGEHIGLITVLEESQDCGGLDIGEVDYVAFNFQKLDHIRRFSEDMELRNIKMNMREVESKENFSLVSRLTLTISLILFGFGLLSIVLYVNNQLRAHLHKIRPNLGTFKAFGLSNRFLVKLYRKIILSYLVVGIGAAFLIVAIVDVVEYLLRGEVESTFNAFSPWLFGSIICLLLISALISTRSTKKILFRTPGDLIYNR